MPYQVQQIIEGKGMPVFVKKEDPVSKALSQMIEHDYSQLPVIDDKDDFFEPIGMITYESILRGIRNFRANIENLKVRDVMVTAPIFSLEDDLFDILDRLKDTNAVLVVSGHGPDLVGIVTSYDTTEYFRNRTEDLMRVEDIELMIKEFISSAYAKPDGQLNRTKLDAAISEITKKHFPEGGKKKSFDELTLSDYIALLIFKDTWAFFEPIFHVDRDNVTQLLNGIREIRNALAHFRGDISSEQRDMLKFGTEWLSRCQEEYQERKQEEERKKIVAILDKEPEIVTIQPGEAIQVQASDDAKVSEFSIAEESTSGSRYAALADWLQSRPGRIDQIPLSLNQVEEIIGSELPPSARNYRAWWANDSVGHTHSQLWMDAGWRTTVVNLSEGKVTFGRIREREKAYIDFFTKLLHELRGKKDFPVRNVKPDGASWMEMLSIPRGGPAGGSIGFSFSRNNRFRVELYLDLGDQTRTKAAFDRLYAQKDPIETQLGAVGWERLDNRRASRIAMYHNGQIMDDSNHGELILWAADTMTKFYKVILEPAEKAIREAKQA